MESEVVAAVRRQLEADARELDERLDLSSKHMDDVEKQAAEETEKQQHDIQRLVERLRSKDPQAEERKQKEEISFDFEDDEEPAGHTDDNVGSGVQESLTATRSSLPDDTPEALPVGEPPAAEPPVATPQADRRRNPSYLDDEYDDEDMSEQTWMR